MKKDRIPAAISWSGGKDGFLALQNALSQNAWDIRCLLCTMEAPQMEVKMHGVSRQIMHMQAESIGIPLHVVPVYEGSNAHFETQLANALQALYAEGIRHLIFGDIFLQDLRAYREELLTALGWQAVFPLWQTDSRLLATRFVKDGFRALVCCVNTSLLSAAWVGKEISAYFFDELPDGVDLCGENGEYHSFCYDGPLFQRPIPLRISGQKKFVMPIDGTGNEGPVICQAVLEPDRVAEGLRESRSFL